MITFIASHLKQNSRQEEKQGETKNEKKKKPTTYTQRNMSEYSKKQQDEHTLPPMTHRWNRWINRKKKKRPCVGSNRRDLQNEFHVQNYEVHN